MKRPVDCHTYDSRDLNYRSLKIMGLNLLCLGRFDSVAVVFVGRGLLFCLLCGWGMCFVGFLGWGVFDLGCFVCGMVLGSRCCVFCFWVVLLGGV